MPKPLKGKDADIQALILIGLYQLFYMRVPDHAAINETVSCVRKPWAKGLVNAVLRNALRQFPEFPDGFSASLSFRQAHPQWLTDRIQNDWSENAEAILEANNQRAPMTLRVNLRRISRDDYLQKLDASDIQAHPGKLAETSVILEQSHGVNSLPGFLEGMVSVQDEASQLLPSLLHLSSGMTVLDACAAPGGKTSAMLEQQPDINITALDNEERRLARMQENLERLHHSDRVRLVCCDATKPPVATFPAGGFDRILIDAPCSATGVIRRHPDIKVLRTPEQVDELVKKQEQLLDALWPCLSRNGVMLYSTCSVLKAENTDQIIAFLARTTDATLVNIDASWGVPCDAGRQLLPGSDEQDGFYYALLQKC
jgi:16S rRNA (cytosine967-C5)-methyltransferase